MTHVAALHEALAESVDHLWPWIPWATPAAPTVAEVRTRIESWIEQRATGANVIYAMFAQPGGGLVGGAGLYNRVGPGALEIGYWLRASGTGRGFATEAATVLTHVAFTLPGIDRLEMHVDVTNVTSARIPQRLGYVPTRVRADALRDGTPRMVQVFTQRREDAGC